MSFCIQCGAQLKEGDIFCTQCGEPVIKSGKKTQKNIDTQRDQPMKLVDEKTSNGIVKQSVQNTNAGIPAEIKQWNWGAFWLTWIWGIGNSTWIALLALLPIANIVMPFVLGAKGSEWAWKNKQWKSIAHFKTVQTQWAKWGLIIFILVTAFVVSMSFMDINDFYW